MDDNDVEEFITEFSDRLRALITKREASARTRAVQRMVAAAAGLVESESVILDPALTKELDKRQPTAKAPRGSVEKVVSAALAALLDGFTIDDVLRHAAANGLPAVNGGSVRNYLRDLEGNHKIHRKGDQWFNGPAASANIDKPTGSDTDDQQGWRALRRELEPVSTWGRPPSAPKPPTG